MLRSFDNSAIAADVCHRTQGIHFLRARYAWHTVHGHRCCAAGCQLLQQHGVLCRPEETDQCLVRAQTIGFTALGGAYLENDIGVLPDLGGRIHKLAARRGKCLIRVARGRARPFFYKNLKTELL